MLKTLLGTAATTCAVCAIALPAKAVSLTTGTTLSIFLECFNDGISLVVGENPTDAAGWQYAIDSSSDGVAGSDIGGNAYEIYSLGVLETTDSIYVAINSNTPYTGNPNENAQNGSIAFGDLFINLEALTTDFQEASDTSSLYAVRFVENNDSGVPQLGLYENVTATSVTETNSGFESIEDYNQYVSNNGGTPNFGDLAADTDYFDAENSLNEIASGDFVTEIVLLSESDLTDVGFNWEQAPGEYTIAFKIEKSALPSDDVESVPEPRTVGGLIVFGILAIARRFRKSLF